MKTMMAAVLMCLAAGAQAHGRTEAAGAPGTVSAVVVQGQGALAVRVDGQLIYLNGPVVYDAKGQRSGVRLAPGMPLTFVLAPEGSNPRIKEVWTTN